ncbi:ergothioneine biosynthesis protein EgtB [Psychroflexus salis]|uniref:Ergothioneine biosynthesis protein EgtB n=2 Tax=Psychroflexus salis TaxID=1526574 RepID=A0A917A3F0_9FLAO|nr:ergothioneine biosynthesis protein EgtB [Psychroflexus salis]
MAMKNELIQLFQETRINSLQICKHLAIEDYGLQPVEFVSPPKWHLGHTTWFFEAFFLSRKEGYTEYHPDFSFVFNSYYESLGQKILRSERGNLSRPTVQNVLEYRKYVDEHVANYLQEKELTDKEIKIIETGIHHEKQHQELLYTDIKYSLGTQALKPIYDEKFKETIQQEPLQWLSVEKGLYSVGHADEGFCYDNETPQHQVYLNDFFISSRLVSNAEYIEFIEDGGYQNVLLWHAEAWDWLQNNNISFPLYWQKEEGEYYSYQLSGYQQIEAHSPVTHISYYEAFAFAQWKKMRLPTEFEWEVACKKFNYGARWEWTESAYQPYPGYQKAEGALGEYNGKFMVNQKVLRGHSIVTSPQHSRPTYRNFFHPHLRWQFTGIRLAK